MTTKTMTMKITMRERLRELRRPLVLAILSFGCLGLHHILLRAMAHGHVAHVLLGTGNAAPPTGAALLAVSLVIVRFISIILVPGLLLAAAAEVVAYLLVGPKRMIPEDAESEPVIDPS